MPEQPLFTGWFRQDESELWRLVAQHADERECWRLLHEETGGDRLLLWPGSRSPNEDRRNK